jgi:hypothetical protein
VRALYNVEHDRRRDSGLPRVHSFIQNFARYCGAPRSVFVGQLTAAIREALTGQKERYAQVAQEYGTMPGQEAESAFMAGERIAERIRAL